MQWRVDCLCKGHGKWRCTDYHSQNSVSTFSGSISNILQDKLCYRKVSLGGSLIFWCKKSRDRVACSKFLQIYDSCDPGHLHEVITGDETWVQFYEPERKTQNRALVPKEETHLKLQKEISLRRHCPQYSSTRVMVIQKPCKEEKRITRKYYKCLCLPRSTIFTRDSNWTLACATAHKCKVMQEYFPDENIKISPHLPSPQPYSLWLALIP